MLSAEVEIWGVSLPTVALLPTDLEYLRNISRMNRPSVEWLWQEMDRVWDDLKLDNRGASEAVGLEKFYSHPVWVVNGVFSAVDPISVQHRQAIAEYICSIDAKRVADYGGGFGELALRLYSVDLEIKTEIVEPYSSALGKARVGDNSAIEFVPMLSGQYDCIVAQDVLEHVERPLELVEQMVQATKMGGYVVFANCFHPVIKCHLPSTFYLRHTFAWVVKGMGLRYEGRVPGASHALAFRRIGDIERNKFMVLHIFAKFIGSILNRVRSLIGTILSSFKNKVL